jgi:hypothetical protein
MPRMRTLTIGVPRDLWKASCGLATPHVKHHALPVYATVTDSPRAGVSSQSWIEVNLFEDAPSYLDRFLGFFSDAEMRVHLEALRTSNLQELRTLIPRQYRPGSASEPLSQLPSTSTTSSIALATLSSNQSCENTWRTSVNKALMPPAATTMWQQRAKFFSHASKHFSPK